MSLEEALGPLAASLASPGVHLGAKAIKAGDEAAFLDPALESTPENLNRRRASGAARILAGRLLRRLGGMSDAAVGRLESGAPRWPGGILGSIAHDAEDVIVAVARAGGPTSSLGVDIEPAAPLPVDLAAFVLTPGERRFCAGDALLARRCFAVKEAVYKAINPLDGSPLEYCDISCAENGVSARIADGRRLRVFSVMAPKIVVVATLDGFGG